MTDEKRRRMSQSFVNHAEDIALTVGALMLAVGAALLFGAPAGLLTLGALLVAYGVWITERRR